MPFHAELAQFLSSYGLAAVVLGTFLEGETIVILAGYLAHQGYLNPWHVALAALAGSFASDQTLFFLARYRGAALLRRFRRMAARVRMLERTVRRHEIWLILGFRFLYGLRNVTPVFLGLGRVKAALFVPLNLIGAVVWAAAFTAAGYYFGEAVTTLLGRAKYAELAVILGIAAVGLLFWLRRRRKHPPEDE